MTRMDLKIFDVWDQELSLSKLIDECFQCKNTHIIVDCSKESSLTLGSGMDVEQRVLEVNLHNELYCNRVDIVLGNYKITSEEWVEPDITLDELESKNENIARNERLAREGAIPWKPVKVSSAMSEAARYNFFDNVYHCCLLYTSPSPRDS